MTVKGLVIETPSSLDVKNGTGICVKFTNAHLPNGSEIIATVPGYLAGKAREKMGQEVNVTAHCGYTVIPEIDSIS